ncbi:hypothetical protein [Clostridium fallax]|uniref:Polysaccharide deacetylase n=1 Tax=Clostridium fallax TaxID=1533 RepID=A0A1M4ZCM8_9CLOT|nr:hypothetical protein [Clostridium fallax]SHF15708.1 hypothetical protein SAMN05443638_1423 [Clostridium fallax]SQB06291.1 Uncharacterised protein [Clostridium fallax]
MNIEICKWYNNVDSPVLFFIDDLANVWVDINNNGKIDLGEDWGYGKREENSSLNYLENEILNNFSKVKATFFIPVGIRVGVIKNPKIKSISKFINCDKETKKFFKSINDNPKYEIAYHGTTHGKVYDKAKDFKQEWELFNSLDEGINTINKGKEIYKDVFENYPKGGKYCGYKSNEYSDKSIDLTGFLWWSRYWNRGIEENHEDDICGKDYDLITNYDVKFFGENHVVDIPSTLSGGLFTGILNPKIKSLKGIIKTISKPYFLKNKLSEIEFLLENKLVISIQEHMSPARDDGKIQNPNIFTDKDSLIYILNYLKSKNVWYCTGTELAEYVLLRENTSIKTINENTFEINNNLNKEINNKFITLKFSKKLDNKKLKDSKGNIYLIRNSIVNIESVNGVLQIL